MSEVRVRFAPSPTGPLHIGGARSALFNYLLAKRYQGTLILRVEDTDLERSSKESEENIKESLRWLEIEWQEGIDVGGPHGPYRQTERLDIYRRYIDQLLETGHAYYCYCTPEELEAERQEQLAQGEQVRYLGKCRELAPEERKALEAEGRGAVIRFRVAPGRIIQVDDMVRGQVSFETDGIGDFIILKSDGIPTYNFAVVVDDFLMGITHIVRAEEHLSNTPRQILLYEAMGFSQPNFAHISLILGKDRSKMSKRHGATSVVQYRQLGYLPEALMNFLALLGWAPEGEEEILQLDDIAKEFSLDRVAKNPAVFDLDKLNWINGCYIRQTPVQKLTQLALPFLKEAGYVEGEPSSEQIKRIDQMMEAVRERLDYLAQVREVLAIFFESDLQPEDEAARQVLYQGEVPLVIRSFLDKVEQTVELNPEIIKQVLKAVGKELGLGGKKVFMPLRVALTGKMHGPELHDIVSILGREEVKRRLERAASLYLGS